MLSVPEERSHYPGTPMMPGLAFWSCLVCGDVCLNWVCLSNALDPNMYGVCRQNNQTWVVGSGECNCAVSICEMDQEPRHDSENTSSEQLLRKKHRKL